MHERRPTVCLTDREFDELREIIYSASGMSFGTDKRYLLEARLQARLSARELMSFSEYIAFLQLDPRRSEEVSLLFNHVTVNETSFFRNMAQLKVFERKILPELIRGKQEQGLARRLRIWSAGCSSGEEVYSIAILIREALGPDVASWAVDIIGNDISTDMIQLAQTALYSEYSMRATPLFYRQRYFERVSDGGYRVRPEVRQMTRFMVLNFSDESGMKRMTGFDVVFCRNVLIYFDEAARKRYVTYLYDSLNPQGYLLLGHSESLHKLSSAFQPIHHPGAIVYRKE